MRTRVPAFSVALLLLALIGAARPTTAQTQLRGHVATDQGEPLPYAHVRVGGTHAGTATNAKGDFVLRVDSLPIRLHVSYLGYGPVDTLVADAAAPLRLHLAPASVELAEVVVSAAEADSLIQRTYHALQARADELKPGRAYYRQHTRNDTVYTEYVETLYQAFTSPIGIEGWTVDQGRYATRPLQGEKHLTVRDFSVFLRLINLIQTRPADEVSALLPLRDDASRYFVFTLDRRYRQAGHHLADVTYHPRASTERPAFSGRLVIDTDALAVLRHEASVRHPDFQPVTADARSQRTENSTLSFDMRFGTYGEGPPVLDRMLIDLALDWVQDGGLLGRRPAFRQQVETKGMLVFYDFEDPGNFGTALIGDRAQEKTDRELIDEREYDPAYWQTNPVIARTPVEEEIIRDLEASEAFDKVFNADTDDDAH